MNDSSSYGCPGITNMKNDKLWIFCENVIIYQFRPVIEICLITVGSSAGGGVVGSAAKTGTWEIKKASI